jgi:hypothetical protein
MLTFAWLPPLVIRLLHKILARGETDGAHGYPRPIQFFRTTFVSGLPLFFKLKSQGGKLAYTMLYWEHSGL